MQLQTKECLGLPEAGKGWEDPPLVALERARHTGSRILASRAVRGYISVVLSHPLCGYLL